MAPDAKPVPQWLQQLQVEFPELAWHKRSWVAKVLERDPKQIDRYKKGESVPDERTVQTFRARLELWRRVERAWKEERTGRRSLAKPVGTVEGMRPHEQQPPAEDDMKEWLARLLKFIEGVIDSEDQALALRDHVMYEWLPEWKRQHPLAEGSQS